MTVEQEMTNVWFKGSKIILKEKVMLKLRN